MNGQKSFGRRTPLQRQQLRAEPKRDAPAPDVKLVFADTPSVAPVFAETSAEELARLHKEIISPAAHDEWHEREQPAKRKFKVPWRQVVLTASLCFGIGALVLPDTINDDLDWLLYGLMAISGYVGFSNRFLKS
jgi:hypothetical protein